MASSSKGTGEENNHHQQSQQERESETERKRTMPNNFFTKKREQLSTRQQQREKRSDAIAYSEEHLFENVTTDVDTVPKHVQFNPRTNTQNSQQQQQPEETNQMKSSPQSEGKQKQLEDEDIIQEGKKSGQHTPTIRKTKSILKQTNSKAEEEQLQNQLSKKRKRSPSSSKSKKRNVSQKLCTKVSKDMSDSDRFLELVKVVAEHTKNTYCAKHKYMRNLHDRIFSQLSYSAEKLVSKHYSKSIKPNEQNMALRAKEQLLQCLISKLEAEERSWKHLNEELTKREELGLGGSTDSNDVLSAIKADLTVDSSVLKEEEPQIRQNLLLTDHTPIEKKMQDLMTNNIMDIDFINICTGEIAQLHNIAIAHKRHLDERVKTETEFVHRLEDPPVLSENSELLYIFSDPKKLLQSMQNDKE